MKGGETPSIFRHSHIYRIYVLFSERSAKSRSFVESCWVILNSLTSWVTSHGQIIKLEQVNNSMVSSGWILHGLWSQNSKKNCCWHCILSCEILWNPNHLLVSCLLLVRSGCFKVVTTPSCVDEIITYHIISYHIISNHHKSQTTLRFFFSVLDVFQQKHMFYLRIRRLFAMKSPSTSRETTPWNSAQTRTRRATAARTASGGVSAGSARRERSPVGFFQWKSAGNHRFSPYDHVFFSCKYI